MCPSDAARPRDTEYLRLLKADLILDPCDGTDIIPGSNDMFKAGIDFDFINWGADEPGQPTGKTPVSVYELIKDARFADMFGSLGNIASLCLTQAQIKNFIKKHRQWLRQDGCATFFLFESRNLFFVANVDLNSDGALYVYVPRFENSNVWNADYRIRVVAPKLAVSPIYFL